MDSLHHVPAPGRERLLAFAFAASDLLIETGPDGKIAWAAGAFAARFGAEAERFVGCALAELIAPADHAALACAIAMLAARGRLPPVTIRLADASLSSCMLAGLALPGPEPRLCLTLGPLPALPPSPKTGVQDPVTFQRELEARVRAGQPGSLGLIELPGPEGTDPRAARVVLEKAVGEIGGPAALIGELGPGRYGVLGQPELDLAAVAELLAACLGPSGKAGLQRQALALSEAGVTLPETVRALRLALGGFAANGAAATRSAGFAEGVGAFLARARSRREALRDTIAKARFELAFQPVVSLADRRPHHFEALIRPILTPSSPARTPQDFVTLCEAVGLAQDLDCAVLSAARAAMSRAPEALVAVNVSGLSMEAPGFREGLAGLADGLGGRLLVELTETAEISDLPAAAATLAGLRATGIRTCIDDFGAGAAAFRYLRGLKVDFVKIDGAYVRGAAVDPRDRSFVTVMVDLARSVGARVIAEMIETEEQAALMASLGVHYGQGFLFGRPGALPGSRARR